MVYGFSDFLTSVKGPRLLETTIQVILTALSRGAGSMPTSRQASRSAPAGATGDRKTNDSAPRQRRREAEPQRRLTGWAAARSRLVNMRQKRAVTHTK